MAIYNNVGGSFQEVDKVFSRGAHSTTFIEKVWVHNGTKYIMVKGRVLEVIWEKDLSTYGGMSWGATNGRTPDHNVLRSMYILSNGDLIGVVDCVVNNGAANQYSTGRSSIIKLASSNGDISTFSPVSTPGQSWTNNLGYAYKDQPIGMVKIGDYFITYSYYGSFYKFRLNGDYIGYYQGGTSRYIYDGAKSYGIKVSVDNTGQCIYYAYNDPQVSNGSCYIFRISSELSTPNFHYVVGLSASYHPFTNLIVDSVSRLGVACVSSQSGYELRVFSTNYSSTSTVSKVPTLFALATDEMEQPIAIKDGFVYLVDNWDASKLRKRKLSDLSLVWSVNIPRVTTTVGGDCALIQQPVPECDGGFMLPHGCVFYPNGDISKETLEFVLGTITPSNPCFCFDETLNTGYLMNYDGVHTGASKATVCKVIKFKEVRK